MPIQIDWVNELLLITSPSTDVDLQSLHDFVEDERGMASPVGLTRSAILTPEGKIEDPTNPGVFSQIILVLQSPWQIQFWGGSGYTRVYGGKIVGGLSDQPIKATGTAGDVTVLESPVDGVYVAPAGSTPDAIADAVWDEVLTGATHNIPTSAGRRLRQLGDAIPGDVSDASPTTLSFDTTVTGKADGFYNDQYIRFSDGNLEGQVRVVESYLGTNGTITVDEEWTEAPANGNSFDLLPVHIHPHGQIADEVWNSQLVDYVASGTAGFALRNMLDFTDRTLGLSQENYYLDQTSYVSFEDQKYMTAGRIRIYDNAGSVGTANDVKATYTITASWTDDEMDNYSVTKL